MPEPALRDSRIYPVRDAAPYPGSDFLDMVLFFPVVEGTPYRLWLLTEADNPEVAVNHVRLQAQGHSDNWLDFGVIEDLWGIMGSGFGQVRFYGIGPAAAPESYFIICSEVEKVLFGDILSAQRLMWGITRPEVGRTSINPNQVRVGRPTEFLLTWKVGDRGLPAGAHVRLCFPHAFSRPQADNPAEPGHLAVLRSPRPLVLAGVDRSLESHEKIDAIFTVPEGLPADATVEISYRTDFTYLFESTYGTMDRRYWYSHLPPMALAVAVDERMMFVPPCEEAGHHVHYRSGPGERLHLFLPGRCRQGDPVTLVGILTDLYRNISPSGSPKIRLDFDLVLESGARQVSLGHPAGRFVANHRFEVPLPDLHPGVHRVRVLDAESGSSLAVSNPLEIMAASDPKPRIYWGEIHGHSEMSDGSGGFEEMFRHARDEAALDFAASADHACYFSDNEWLWMQDVINSFNKRGRFITLVGYEWAGKQGHRNVYTSEKRLDLFRGMYPPMRSIDVVWKHFEGNETVVGGPHTGHTGDFWDAHNPAVERFIEIYSMWGAFDELVNKLLDEGAVLGVTGGGDCHEGHCFLSAEDPDGQGVTPHGFAGCIFYKCGITGAVMATLDRPGLLAALRERRTYATTGPRILIDFSVSGLEMGATGAVEGLPAVRAEVHACGPIARIEVVRDGAVAHTVNGDGLDAALEWEDGAAAPGKHWYYVKVTQQDEERAWTSPVWVEV